MLPTNQGLNIKMPHIVKYSDHVYEQRSGRMYAYNKQIFHAFLFNIRNYSPEVINIYRREAELNIILPRVNNFNIKQKKAWNICFIICHQHQTGSGNINTNKTQQTELRHI